MWQEDQEELSPNPSEEPWPKKFPEPLSWRSDEEDEDSDFGEEQRDRYLKVFLFSSWHGETKLESHTNLTTCSFPLQVSISAEHQEFFVFLQRLVSPVLEAYSGAAIFIHSLSQPTSESDYTQRLFRYLLTRTERGVAVYGSYSIIYNANLSTFCALGRFAVWFEAAGIRISTSESEVLILDR